MPSVKFADSPIEGLYSAITRPSPRPSFQATANLTGPGSPAFGAGPSQMAASNLTISYTAMPTETLRFMLSQRHLNQTCPCRVLMTRPQSSICAVFEWRTRWRIGYFKPWHMLASNACSSKMIKPRTGLEGFWTLYLDWKICSGISGFGSQPTGNILQDEIQNRLT